MRLLVFSFGMFLALTAGAWGGAPVAAVADTCCMDEAGASHTACVEHDCCRAVIEDANRHESQTTSHEAAHENPAAPDQPYASRAGTNSCAAADAAPNVEDGAVAFGRRGLSSCGECCAGGRGGSPAAAAVVVAPEQNKARRTGGTVNAVARDPHAHARASQHAERRHAPPPTHARRHILHSRFLI